MYLKIITQKQTHVFEAPHISYKVEKIQPCILFEGPAEDNPYLKYKDVEDSFTCESSEPIKIFLADIGKDDFIAINRNNIFAAYIMNENGKTIDTPVRE